MCKGQTLATIIEEAIRAALLDTEHPRNGAICACSEKYDTHAQCFAGLVAATTAGGVKLRESDKE